MSIYRPKQRPLWQYAVVYNYVRLCWRGDLEYNSRLHKKSYMIATDRQHRMWLFKRWQRYIIEQMDYYRQYPEWLDYWFNCLDNNVAYATEKYRRHTAYTIRSIEH